MAEDEQDGNTQPITDALAASRERLDITRGFLDPLLPAQQQDEVLRTRGGGDLETYEHVLRDDQVMMAFQQRRLALVATEWEVEPGGTRRRDKAAADALREQLAAVRWDNANDRMHWGLLFGYAVGEMMWVRDGRTIAIDDIAVRNRRRFVFDGAGRLRLRTYSNMTPGELMPARKFWCYTVGATHDDEPYGLGLGHWLYWPVWFKRFGLAAWSKFLDRFGDPIIKGEYPRGSQQAEINQVRQALEGVQGSSVAAVPQGTAIELIEAAKNTTQSYEALHDRMNAAISKIVMGQTMTADAGSSRSQGEVHMHARQDLVKADADLLCSSFNLGPARWLTEWNFPGAAAPRVWRRVEEGEDLNTAAERDNKLSQIGYSPTLERVQAVYGDGYEARPANGGGGVAGTGPASFAEPRTVARHHGADQDQIEAAAEQLTTDSEALIGKRVDDLIALAEESQDLATFRERLSDLAGAAPPNALTAALQRAGYTSHLWGRWRADKDSGDLAAN